jgi:hypothetical protein
MENGESRNNPLFETIGAGAESVDALSDDGQSQQLVEEIESMCINCEENVLSFSTLTSGHNSSFVD